MRDLARKFFAHKHELHGEGDWIIVFCDNLSEQLDPEVKQIFVRNKVVFC